MLHRQSLPLLLFLSSFSYPAAAASRKADVVVIANAEFSSQEISADDLKAIFLGTKRFLKGSVYIQPVLESGGPVHNAFVKSYLGKTEFGLQTYYRSMVFSGQGSMPVILDSDADVLAFVEKTRGAIGYIGLSTRTDKVKTLRVR